MPEHEILPAPKKVIRAFSFLTHAQLIAAFDTYLHEVGKTPRIEIRGAVEFIEPSKRTGTWRKTCEVDLPDWVEVCEWTRETSRVLIWYRRFGGRFRNAPQLTEQWVRPTSLFDQQWFDVRLCPRSNIAAYSGGIPLQQSCVPFLVSLSCASAAIIFSTAALSSSQCMARSDLPPHLRARSAHRSHSLGPPVPDRAQSH